VDGRTDVHMDGHLRPILLGRLFGVDLIMHKLTHTHTHTGLMTILPGETPLVILCSHLSCPRPHSELNGWCDYMKACCLSKAWFHSNTRNACKALCKKKYACKIKSTQETQQMQKNYARKKTKVRKRKSRN